jgi:type II secretion system protein H
MAPIKRREGKETIVISRAGSNRGFSFLELVVVLALLGLMSMIVLPSLDRGLKKREVRKSAMELAATARGLRSKAIYESIPQRLVFDPLENSYQAIRGKKVLLSSDVKISGVEGGEFLGGEVRQFLFFPNGSALGGEVRISGDQGVTYVIRLFPLSGRVVVKEGEE